MQWRRKEKNADWLRILMWVDGWPINQRRAHTSMITLLHQMRHELDQGLAELSEQAGDSDDPLHTVARQLANQRGKNTVLPRRRGITVEQRTQTIEGILGSILGGRAVAPDDPQARMMLAAMGTDDKKAHRNDLPPFTVDGLHPLFGDPDIIDLDRLIEAVETATDAELQVAQRGANLIAVRLPMMAALAEAMTGGTGTPIDLVAINRDQPVVYLLAIGLFIALERAGLTSEMRGMGEPLSHAPEYVTKLREAAALAPDELEQRMRGDQKRIAAARRAIANAPLDQLETTRKRQGPRTR